MDILDMDYTEHAKKIEKFKKSPLQQLLRNKIRGSLIGGAAGDALGYSVEFMRLSEIRRKYGERGITSYELNHKGKALISDDTQMTLFTANGLLYGQTRAILRGIAAAPHHYVFYAYRDWLGAQTGQERWNDSMRDGATYETYQTTWLYNVPELHKQRAPGMTCLGALKTGRMGTLRDVINNSKGCGGVMRAAPVGLFCAFAKDPKIVIEEGAAVAAITHGHKLGWLPAAFLAELLRHIVYDWPELLDSLKVTVLETIYSLDKTYGTSEHWKEWNDLKRLLAHAIELTGNSRTDADNIKDLGEGWVAEEALAIALYCAVKHSDNFSDCIIAAVNHDGDSDSTGSIAGNIIGALLGLKNIDKKWLDHLEIRTIIQEIADDLCDGCQMDSVSLYVDQPWMDKYVYCLYGGKRRKMRKVEKGRRE